LRRFSALFQIVFQQNFTNGTEQTVCERRKSLINKVVPSVPEKNAVLTLLMERNKENGVG
jgi:hypothetical protein